MHSIRVKMTAITIAAILTTFLSVLIVCYSTIQVENDRRSVEIMNLVGRDTQRNMEKTLEGIARSVETTANIASDMLDSVVLVENGAVGTNAENTEPTPNQTAQLDTYLEGYLSRVQEVFASIAGHTRGVVTYYYCIDPVISQSEHGFFYSKVGKTGFEEQEPLEAGKPDPKDPESMTWYYTPIRRGRPSWVGPYRADYLEDMWIGSFIVPIYKSGSLIGVLGMDIPLETLTDLVAPIRVFKTGFACLLDGEGHVLYHPDLEMGSVVDGLDETDYEKLLKRESSGDELFEYNKGGKTWQMYFATLSNGLKLVVTAPVSEVNASITRLARVILPVTALIIIAFVLLVLVVMGIITRPLQRLTAASGRLAAADYDVELDYQGKDEVGELTKSFSRMRDQLKLNMEDLSRRAYTDALTGLPNMRRFMRQAQEKRDRMVEQGRKPVMLYFNLTGMKEYNRQYGFEEGDRLITAIGKILSEKYGEENICSFGQDHFAAVTDEAHVVEVLEEVFRECQKANGGRSLPLRVGIYPNELEDVNVSIACDRAKYAGDQYKNPYSSGYRYFDSAMLRQIEDDRYIISHLDQALKERWISVYYQSIIRAASGKVCDEEALARWNDPVRGFLSPAAFIPALEEARLIYKLDLYVVEQILEKMKRQEQAGIFVVPVSVNLSRADFDSCDIVEEIRRRVDEAGIGRDMLTIEITESIIGSNFDFMKEQVERFRALGFAVWMDDFGSGYSSLDVLQHIHFDLIKFDMRFMERFGEGEEGKIILTEMVKMAIGLGVETICEGVETEEQVEFLREIGCTKIQGYYFSRPNPVEKLFEMAARGGDANFENPAETAYFSTIGGINLYDMAVLAGDDDESMGRYFDTLPMGIMEVDGTQVKYIRCNQSYRDFLKRAFGKDFTTEVMDYSLMPDVPGSAFMAAVIRCSRDGSRTIVDEKISDSITIHTFVRRVAVNPVTGTAAVAVAVLAVLEEDENAGMNYAHIAKALSADYVNLYYVNMDTGSFVEYSPDPIREDLAVERHGGNFFEASRRDALVHLYKEDQEAFISAFNRENIEKALNTQGTFTLTYRLMISGEPVYVNLKAVRQQGDRSHIIIGVNNVDGQMKQQEQLERIRAEQVTYARISALSGNYICIYTVDPRTDHFVEYSATSAYEGLGIAKQGEDFFDSATKEAERVVYEEDRRMFLGMFNKKKIMSTIERSGLYELRYRVIMNGGPRYLSVKGALVEEKDGPKLIVGVNDIDAQVRREQEYEQKLFAARSRANLDTLTGVKNRTAYDSMSESLARQIEGGQEVRYAIVICRVTGLADVNETQGREAGDALIRDACAIICETFKHSPVFRVAGDEFAAVAQGHDYEHVDKLVEELEATGHDHEALSGTRIACGMARYDGSGSVASVFERADAQSRR